MTAICEGVFIIDDDRDIRRAVSDVLEDEGYPVKEAANGQEALERLRTLHGEPPCVILLDIMMPVMDGWAFRTEQLRDPRIANIPVVVLTADANAQTKANQMRAHGALTKPVTLEKLLDLISAHCRHANVGTQ